MKHPIKTELSTEHVEFALGSMGILDLDANEVYRSLDIQKIYEYASQEEDADEQLSWIMACVYDQLKEKGIIEG